MRPDKIAAVDSVMPVGLYEKALPSHWPWEKRLDLAADAGYTFVEISIDESDERLARLHWPAGEKAALRRAIELSGVPLLTMCLSGHRRFPLGSRDPAVRERALEIMRSAVAFSVDIGVRIVQVAGYDVYYEPHDAGTEARYLEGLFRATEWAAQAGVMLGLENVDVPISESLERSMRLVRQIDSPWFQMYADMANVTAAGYDPAAELALCGRHLVGVHVKDAMPGVVRGIPFGAGIVPFEAVFRVLAGLGFAGPWLVEMWADLDPSGDPLAAARNARRFVQGLIETSYRKGET